MTSIRIDPNKPATRSKSTKIILAVLGLICWLPMVVYGGYTFKTLYAWFVAPVWHLPLITLPQAIGLNLFVAFLTLRADTRKDTREQYTAFEIQFMGAFLCTALLIFGRIYLAIFF